MANSLAKSLLCALALGSSTIAAQDARRASSELVLGMQSFEIDSKTNMIHLFGPTITQGDMSISADEALATDKNVQAKSEWTFKGNVRIALESTVISASSAVFTFDDKKQLARGELVGQAIFEDTRPQGQDPARGGANKVVYDYNARTLRLTGDAWFQSDRLRADGCDIIYNLTNERVASGSDECRDSFQIRVLPKPGENAAAADPPQ